MRKQKNIFMECYACHFVTSDTRIKECPLCKTGLQRRNLPSFSPEQAYVYPDHMKDWIVPCIGARCDARYPFLENVVEEKRTGRYNMVVIAECPACGRMYPVSLDHRFKLPPLKTEAPPSPSPNPKRRGKRVKPEEKEK